MCAAHRNIKNEFIATVEQYKRDINKRMDQLAADLDQYRQNPSTYQGSTPTSTLESIKTFDKSHVNYVAQLRGQVLSSVAQRYIDNNKFYAEHKQELSQYGNDWQSAYTTLKYPQTAHVKASHQYYRTLAGVDVQDGASYSLLQHASLHALHPSTTDKIPNSDAPTEKKLVDSMAADLKSVAKKESCEPQLANCLKTWETSLQSAENYRYFLKTVTDFKSENLDGKLFNSNALDQLSQITDPKLQFLVLEQARLAEMQQQDLAKSGQPTEVIDAHIKKSKATMVELTDRYAALCQSKSTNPNFEDAVAAEYNNWGAAHQGEDTDTFDSNPKKGEQASPAKPPQTINDHLDEIADEMADDNKRARADDLLAQRIANSNDPQTRKIYQQVTEYEQTLHDRSGPEKPHTKVKIAAARLVKRACAGVADPALLALPAHKKPGIDPKNPTDVIASINQTGNLRGSIIKSADKGSALRRLTTRNNTAAKLASTLGKSKPQPSNLMQYAKQKSNGRTEFMAARSQQNPAFTAKRAHALLTQPASTPNPGTVNRIAALCEQDPSFYKAFIQDAMKQIAPDKQATVTVPDNPSQTVKNIFTEIKKGSNKTHSADENPRSRTARRATSTEQRSSRATGHRHSNRTNNDPSGTSVPTVN